MENHRTDSIPNDSYPVKSDRLLGVTVIGGECGDDDYLGLYLHTEGLRS
jgi:hypothetical protein